MRKHQPDLYARRNVIGLALGEKTTGGRGTGRGSIVVFVERKLRASALSPQDVLPATLDGVEVDVVELGRPELTSNTARMRPPRPGISIGHRDVSAGTLGCLVRREGLGDRFVLSNNHVLARSNAGAFGDAILQPGRADGGTVTSDVVGQLYRFPRISATAPNRVDCAIARPAVAVDREVLDGWSEVRSIPGWFGAEDQGASLAVGAIGRSGRPDLVVFHLDNPGGENHGYYRIGWDLDAEGRVTGGWSEVKAIPGWFGAEDQGAGVALADISGNGRPDLVVFHLDNPGGENHGYYRVGWDLNQDGDVTGGWSPVMPVPGWFGADDQGADIAIGDLDGDGRPELVVLHIDNPAGENHGYYRIGRALDRKGRVTGGWSAPIGVPGWFGHENQGAGVAIGDFTGSARPELVVFHIDNPGGENTCFYRIGRDLRTDGTAQSWSEVRQVSGWAGSENQGGGLALAALSGVPVLFALHLDNPAGENRGYYRTTSALGRTSDFVAPLRGHRSARLGDRVWKSGRTTELTNGSVTYTDASITIAGLGRFDDLIGIRPAMSTRGDSGSALVDSANKVVGLIFAGTFSGSTAVSSWAVRIEHVLEALRWSDVRPVPGWFGAQDQGAGVALARINGGPQPDLIVYHIDDPGGENHGYYRVGWNVDGNGDVTGGWSGVKSIPGWFGAESQGGDIAVADVSGSGQPDLIVFHIDNPAGENHGYYRIGRDLNAHGDVTNGWSAPKKVPGWFGAEDQGAGIAVADLNGSGKPDLVVFHLDNPAGENHGHYRIGWDLDRNGDPTGWSPIMPVPGWFGSEDQGAGIALVDTSGNGKVDLIVYHLDNPSGENRGYYRIGRDLDLQGRVTGGWTSPISIPGWFGAQNQGGGVAAWDLTGSGDPDLLFFQLDNPGGENHGYYRVGFDIRRTGQPARWFID